MKKGGIQMTETMENKNTKIAVTLEAVIYIYIYREHLQNSWETVRKNKI